MTAGLSVSVQLTWRRMSYLNIGKNSCQKLLPFQAVWNYVKGCNDRVRQFRLNPEKIQKSCCKGILCNYFHLVKKPLFVLGNNKHVSLFLTGCTPYWNAHLVIRLCIIGLHVGARSCLAKVNIKVSFQSSFHILFQTPSLYFSGSFNILLMLCNKWQSFENR